MEHDSIVPSTYLTTYLNPCNPGPCVEWVGRQKQVGRQVGRKNKKEPYQANHAVPPSPPCPGRALAVKAVMYDMHKCLPLPEAPEAFFFFTFFTLLFSFSSFFTWSASGVGVFRNPSGFDRAACIASHFAFFGGGSWAEQREQRKRSKLRCDAMRGVHVYVTIFYKGKSK